MKREPLGLKAYALSLLARREYSRTELRARLLTQARKLADNDTDNEADADTAAVDEVLTWLAQQRYQSDDRFIESRLHARAPRLGASRIRQELSRHGLALDPEAEQQLRSSELERAREVWQRKFGEVAPDAASRARQARFLAARGFAADVVWRIVGGRVDE